MKNKLYILLTLVITNNIFPSVIISGTNSSTTSSTPPTTGLITQSSTPTPFTQPMIQPVTIPTITSYTPPVITPVTTPTITPVTSPTITPVTTPTTTPVTPPVTVTPPAVKITPPVHTPTADSTKSNESEKNHASVVITNNDTQTTTSSEKKDTTSISSPYRPNLNSDSTQINLNAPVPTIKVGEKFVFIAPEGSKIHPTASDLDTKLKADKRADSTITETVISSESDNNGSKLTITGQRASMPSEPPYPVIVEEKTKNGLKKFTTIARIRVVK